ncbi:ThuA domain-containing protein [Larkinella sp. VNQ87]|uniref:ThuA domain-containing protein n=1 Tax=Larkinella sp. VNQ87 TaxID=3400921 RepID=UPI003C0C11B5
MKRIWVLMILMGAVLGINPLQAQDILIVADEIPAMEVLASAFRTQEKLDCKIVTQTELPASLAPFKAVLVYIHKDLNPEPERAFIQYARNGGRLVVLHHSISSAKRKNAEWFPFLGVTLPQKDVNEGGYKYVGDISMEVVNLAPRHFITTHQIRYDTTLSYQREEQTAMTAYPGIVLHKTEGFLNHQLSSPKTVLMGYKFRDATGKLWMQDRATWYMPTEKGWVFYSQPGHAVSDFENPHYARVILNMVTCKKKHLVR